MLASNKFVGAPVGLNAKPLASPSVPSLPRRCGAKRQVANPAEVGRQPRNVAVGISRKEVMDSRFYRRTIADPAWWEDYLTTDRYFKNITNMFDSRIIRAVYGPLTRVIFTSLVVCTWETLRAQGTLPPEFPSITMPNTLPLGLTSFAISLLLVFRTNQSYSRWWEARKIWGTILNRVRDINTQAAVFIPEDEQHYRVALRNWSLSFARTLEQHLQGKYTERPLEQNLEKFLSPKELDLVMKSQHKVVKSISMIGEVANQASINSIERMMIMQNVQCFYDMLGMCERIMRTPMPLPYTRHTSRFLFVFNNALPFALYPTFGWGCIPLSVGVSALLLGIDEIGVQIEEPFGVHHLDPLCGRCETDARSIIAEQPAVASYVRELRDPAGRIAERSMPAEANVSPQAQAAFSSPSPPPSNGQVHKPTQAANVASQNTQVLEKEEPAKEAEQHARMDPFPSAPSAVMTPATPGVASNSPSNGAPSHEPQLPEPAAPQAASVTFPSPPTPPSNGGPSHEPLPAPHAASVSFPSPSTSPSNGVPSHEPQLPEHAAPLAASVSTPSPSTSPSIGGPVNDQLPEPAAPQAASVSSPSQSSQEEGTTLAAELKQGVEDMQAMDAAMAAQAERLAQLLQGMETIGKTFSALGGSVPVGASVQPAPGVLSIEQRVSDIRKYFPNALAVDDFMNRVEVILASKGFTGNNTIAMSNLCRDESCMILEDKIESVFGSCFSTHGLGGVLTCGVIGIKAGLSHSPVMGGKEQYAFFSFPHIAIDSEGSIGKISRPNRPDTSAACGALCACLAQLQAEGLDPNCKTPGVHEAEDPEYSILKQRLARQLKSEGCKVEDLDLVSITKAAERTITNDLKHLISKAVDPSKANYVVFTGVQIHNWATDLTDGKTPSLEFVSVGDCYSVIDGKQEKLDINAVPALSPRQMRLLGHVVEDQHPENELPQQDSVVQEVPRGYLMRRIGGAAGARKAPVSFVNVPSK
ncbi:Bestrophin, RFP-TM, chloride channel-domain-containing protein [Dunaliella salina]|uniref:Bestrophin, RFP-TM, chloride channel-domain-containing protein n=1 Tax=Dunaliella salina TaxID=3046 RepID=A0ABQ7H5K7_DUNSA|nr:Bestrophin, RFP-TM, chloride channel-domain-containing protein [Dunaliella salina]|eukprot:KAF5842133.1 Bestrophin, RFP-TM, chloride channel-domain-containing protein [Dunaliella salina]